MISYGAFGRRKPPVFSVFSVFRGPGPGGSDQVGGGHVNEKSSWDGLVWVTRHCERIAGDRHW